ncbi:hypothetical protein ACFY36_50550 [Actinoplanes sp. NPDC000266]
MLLLVASAVLVVLVAGAVPAQAEPTPAPSPPAVAVDSACVAKAPAQPAGAVAWCMPWAVHVDDIPDGGRSHWVTQCSKAISDEGRASCVAASIGLDETPEDGTASVLMDGPSTGSGPAGLINCALQSPPGGLGSDDRQRILWDSKRSACGRQVQTWATQLYDPDPKRPNCGRVDVSCEVQHATEDALSSGVRTGIQGLVDVVVQGTVFLLSKLATLVFTATAISTPDDAFYVTYNSIAGVLIAVIFVFFIVSTIINGLRTSAGPGPLSTLGGLVRAVLGISFAAGIAYTIVAAWDQATNAVIMANASRPYDASKLVTSFTNLTGGVGTLLVALLLSALAAVGLLLLFVVMLFRGLLATGAALFGAMAMTGQVMPETRHWGRRWFWTVNALGSSKFFIAQLWIYGSRSAYGSDDVMNALRAVLLIWLMVAAPWILLRLTTMWDGYLSDVNAHGLMSTAGNPLELGAAFGSGLRDGAASAGSPAGGAAAVMDDNTANTATTPGPTGQLEAGAGIGDGKGRQAADAASTGGDHGPVGDTTANPSAGEQAGGDDALNASEAEGTAADTAAAQHDLDSLPKGIPGGATSEPAAPPNPMQPNAEQPGTAAQSSPDTPMPSAPEPASPSTGAVGSSSSAEPSDASVTSSGSSPGAQPSALHPTSAGAGAEPASGERGAEGDKPAAGEARGAVAAAGDAPVVPL